MKKEAFLYDVRYIIYSTIRLCEEKTFIELKRAVPGPTPGRQDRGNGMKHLTLAGIVLLIAGCLFPATRHLRSISGDAEGFILERPGRLYGALELREYLPENAPFYVEYGADSCLVAGYRREREQYRTDLFLFNDPSGAEGLYLFTAAPDQPALDIGYRGRIADGRVEVLKGHYLIRVQPLGGGTRDGAAELARLLASRIEGGYIEAKLFDTLPQEDLVTGSEFYFKGPRVFRERYGEDLVRALTISYALEGTVATYEPENHRVELFIIRYPNRATVLAAIDAFTASHPGDPVLRDTMGAGYMTVVHENRAESYLAERGDRLYFMRGGRGFDRSSDLFEYILLGGK